MSRAVPDADVIGQIIVLSPEQIDASDRMLPIDPVWADALGGMMKADGQMDPVVVRKLPGRVDYKLIEGGHRHAGAVKHGLQLEARVVGADAVRARLREASENVRRRTLLPLDRAKAVAELVAAQKAAAGLELEQDGRSVSAHARWKDKVDAEADDATEIISVAYGWAEEVGEHVGLTGRTIRSDLALLRGIPASIAEALRRAQHPVFGSAGQLKALSELEPGEQNKVLSLLLHPQMNMPAAPFDKVTDAVAAMRGKSAPAPDAKRLNAFTGTFDRMPLAEKKGALAILRDKLPKGWSLVEGDAKPSAPAFPPQHAQYRDETLEAIDQVRELIEGLIEDEALDDERHSIAGVLAAKLQVARLTVAGNAFPLDGGKA